MLQAENTLAEIYACKTIFTDPFEERVLLPSLLTLTSLDIFTRLLYTRYIVLYTRYIVCTLCTFAGFLDACPNAFSTVNFSLPVGGHKIQLFATKCGGSQLVSLEEISKRNYTAIHAYTEVTTASN